MQFERINENQFLINYDNIYMKTYNFTSNFNLNLTFIILHELFFHFCSTNFETNNNHYQDFYSNINKLVNIKYDNIYDLHTFNFTSTNILQFYKFFSIKCYKNLLSFPTVIHRYQDIQFNSHGETNYPFSNDNIIIVNDNDKIKINDYKNYIELDGNNYKMDILKNIKFKNNKLEIINENNGIIMTKEYLHTKLHHKFQEYKYIDIENIGIICFIENPIIKLINSIDYIKK